MSVQVNQYIMYGIRLPYEYKKQWEQRTGKDWWDDIDNIYGDDSAFKPEIGGKDGIFVLTDGMNGKYIYIGEVLKKTIDDVPLLESTEIPYKSIYEEDKVKQRIVDIIGPVQQDPAWHIITHYR